MLFGIHNSVNGNARGIQDGTETVQVIEGDGLLGSIQSDQIGLMLASAVIDIGRFTVIIYKIY